MGLDGFDDIPALPPEWYARHPVTVARALLGCLVIAERPEGVIAARIVETEAYGDERDPASHASFRRNGLVRAMWGPPGTAYVYRAYGVFPCLNVVTEAVGHPSAVLIRAIEPLTGADHMAGRLGKPLGPRLASGPGLAGRGLGVTVAENGHPFDRAPLRLAAGESAGGIVAGPRIGVSRGRERLWRFGVAGHPALSRPFPRA
ncbi:MAG TPA: DNA-3-methyladenine glycosylase [Thermomicrobiaceae bacterium]|nr:DNA-3-methyladenine glycosylase [Thermomicrobiaceae bacterium]